MRKLVLMVVVHPHAANQVLAFLQCDFGATVQSVAPMQASRLLIVFSVEVKENDPDAGASTLVCLEQALEEAGLKDGIKAY